MTAIPNCPKCGQTTFAINFITVTDYDYGNMKNIRTLRVKVLHCLACSAIIGILETEIVK
jgi:predicted nucleic-acid-binding Zn-ribbon protein